MSRGISAILLFIVLFAPRPAFSQNHWNMPILGSWDDDSIPSASYGAFSECWGYDHDGREYAFLGSSQGTYFFEVTDPSQPRLIDFFRTKDTVALVINKDYATYSHYLYAVSDQGNNSLQIFDLQYLPDSVVLAYDSDALSKRCHTLFVERDRLYMCHNSRPNNTHGPMDIFSLADPLNPQLLGTVFNQGFFTVHEVHVRNDTAYCANGYNGLWIYDVQNPANPLLLSILDQYPEMGYNHSAWLTDDSRYMAFTDENHGYGVKLYDIDDIHDPKLVSMMRSNLLMVTDSLSLNGSIAHNPYIVGNYLLLSYYHDGVQVFDISNPSNPKRVAWHDTHPQNIHYGSYAGCWGLYPFLPSGNIIASDMSNGLIILDGSILRSQVPDPLPNSGFTIVNNPVAATLTLQYTLPNEINAGIHVYDLTGRLVFKNETLLHQGVEQRMEWPVEGLASGVYTLQLTENNRRLYNGKWVKISN